MLEWIAGAGLAAAAAALFRSRYERKQLKVEEFTLCSEKIKGPRTLVFLSDLHDNEFGADNTDLLSAIKKVRPDAVLIGGDLMVCKQNCSTEQSLKLVKALSSRYPVYYANGNHESRMRWKKEKYGNVYEQYQESLRKMGVHILADDSVGLDGDITVHGLDIDSEYYEKRFGGKMSPGYIRKKLGGTDKEHFHLLLAHSPLFFSAYERWGADLTLSGHFHGGTIRLPFLGGVMTPQYQFFLPWCAGFFEENNRYMIVSRGLGTHSINIRLNNKPQLVVIRLEAKGINEKNGKIQGRESDLHR